MSIRIQMQNFDVSAEISSLQQGRLEVGAIVSFIGCVRRTVSNRPLKAMTLEYYPGMTERELEKIENEAKIRWKLEDSLIVHRVGELVPGEQIVLAITAAQHRHDAFESGQFIMDFLKTNAPFWKKETFLDGSHIWTEARTQDDVAAKLWNIKT